MNLAPARAAEPGPGKRALFINSGILGHRAVAALMKDTVKLIPALDATHIDLGGDLTMTDRIVRRLFSVPLAPRSGGLGNLDLRRWREELNVGLLASRRIAAAEAGASHRFDVLHFHTQAAAYASLGRMKRTPSIVSIDATQRLASQEAGSPLARLTYQPNIRHDRQVFGRAAAIIATSEWAAHDLVADDPRLASKTHVMPYPVRCWCDAVWVRQRAQRRGRPLRALFMGGDFPRKGGPDLLDAWREGGFQGVATLDLVTDWPLGPSDVPPGVRLHRGVEHASRHWLDLWREADLFVMPTRHEAFGMVFQEAAAAGLPVIATNVNAIPEIVQDGTTGLLVRPGDRAALMAALRTLLEQGDLRARMGGAALDRMRTLGAPDRYAAKLDAIIRSVLTS
jgi:glycosyltransferase involved in cell wall biosynthesis